MTTEETISKTAGLLKVLVQAKFSSPESSRARKLLENCSAFSINSTSRAETAENALSSAIRAFSNFLCTLVEEGETSMSAASFAANLLDLHKRMNRENGKWEALEFIMLPGDSLAE